MPKTVQDKCLRVLKTAVDHAHPVRRLDLADQQSYTEKRLQQSAKSQLTEWEDVDAWLTQLREMFGWSTEN